MDGKASGGAYGAGMAGGAFNVLAFIKKPQVILRIVSWVSFDGLTSRISKSGEM